MLQPFKRFLITKKAGHSDEEVFIQCVQFFGIFLYVGEVGRKRLYLVEGHAPFQTAAHGGRFVVGEVDAIVFFEQGQRCNPFIIADFAFACEDDFFAQRARVGNVLKECLGHFFR